MCVVSLVMDSKNNDWMQRYYQNHPHQPYPPPNPSVPLPTQTEIDEFRRLLERAREYDRKNNEPDCEMEEKRDLLRKLAKALGVSIDFIEATPTTK